MHILQRSYGAWVKESWILHNRFLLAITLPVFGVFVFILSVPQMLPLTVKGVSYGLPMWCGNQHLTFRIWSYFITFFIALFHSFWDMECSNHLLGNGAGLGSTSRAELSPEHPPKYDLPLSESFLWLHQHFSSAWCSRGSVLLKFMSKVEFLLSSLRMDKAQTLGNQRKKTFNSMG